MQRRGLPYGGSMIRRLYFAYINMYLIALFLLLPGCAKVKSYKKKPLRPLCSYVTYQAKQDDIHIYAKKYDQQDCIQLFGSRGSRLIHHKHDTCIYPIQLSIKNNSQTTWILNKNSIDLKLTPYHHVAHRIQNHTFLRMVSIVAVGTAFTTLTAIGGTTLLVIGMFTWSIPAAIAGGALCASVPFMILVNTPMSTTVQGIQSLRTNTRIKQDIKQKSLTRTVILEPGQTTDTILFVKGSNYKPVFDLTLFDQDDAEHTQKMPITLASDQPMLDDQVTSIVPTLD